MQRKVRGMSRRDVLAAAGVATLAGVTAGPASAAPQKPAPVGDDVGFLAFGAVAEGVLAAFYSAALRLHGAWSPIERKLLEDAHKRSRDNVERLNAALGPDDAVPLEDFARSVRIGTRAGALKVGRELEDLVAGVYLTGVGYAGDAGTRVLLGRLLAVASHQGSALARLAGRPLGGLPAPIDLEAAGLKINNYIKDPS